MQAEIFIRIMELKQCETDEIENKVFVILKLS